MHAAAVAAGLSPRGDVQGAYAHRTTSPGRPRATIRGATCGRGRHRGAKRGGASGLVVVEASGEVVHNDGATGPSSSRTCLLYTSDAADEL